MRGGGLPCGGCQRFESAYLQLMNLADRKLYDSTQFFRFGGSIYDLSFMDVDKIHPFSSTLGWHSLIRAIRARFKRGKAYGCNFQAASPSSTTLVLLSTTPFSRFRLLPFRSPLLRESLLLSFPLATKMFQFARLSLACPWIQQQFERLPYSGISGSMLIFNSPKHFVDYYALPRLWVPRYPPILVVPEVPATGEPGTERPSPPFPPDSLVLRTLVLRMSDCPSPTLTAQPENGRLMRSTY
ncbi:UNVERIFIED_CONTAM: hypothetical protein Sindi_2349200 [Sesamum indicum]